MSKTSTPLLVTLLLALCAPAGATEPAAPASSEAAQPASGGGPIPVPLTRPEMKRALDQFKSRQPRLPLPPPTAEEVERSGRRPPVNNARMRRLYLPEELQRGGFSRGRDPQMSFDAAFATMLFWIASRANNCHY